MRLKEILNNVEIKQKIGFKNNKVEDIAIEFSKNLDKKILVLFQSEIRKKKLKNDDFKGCKASAIITEEFFDCDIPLIIPKDIRKAYSIISSNFYDNPKDELQFIFVTGTNGKTTTTYFISQIFRYCNEEIGIIGTLGCKYKDYCFDSKMTTPDPHILHKVLRDFVKMGCKRVVM